MAWHGARPRRPSRRRQAWTGHFRTATLAVLLLTAAVAFGIERWEPRSSVAGVTIVDGDSLRNQSHEFRLYGIDAPELHQTCTDEQGRSYRCGRDAKGHLARLVTEPPTCRRVQTDRYGRTVARCEAGGRELNRAMVEDGWAVAYLTHSPDYAMAEAAARRAKRGIWRGRFETPQSWRDRSRKRGGHADTSGSGDALPPD